MRAACQPVHVPWARNGDPTPLRVTARESSLLIESVRQSLFPQLTLLCFVLPRSRIALQRLEIAVGRAQETLAAIAFDCAVQHRLHRRLFLLRELPQQFMGVRADADVRRSAFRLHSGIVTCVRRCIQTCIQIVILRGLCHGLLVVNHFDRIEPGGYACGIQSREYGNAPNQE
jgi:hypothetical protein